MTQNHDKQSNSPREQGVQLARLQEAIAAARRAVDEMDGTLGRACEADGCLRLAVAHWCRTPGADYEDIKSVITAALDKIPMRKRSQSPHDAKWHARWQLLLLLIEDVRRIDDHR